MQLDSWIDVLPMLAAIAAVLYMPGALIVAATGQHRPLHIIALAVPVSMSIAGVGGILASTMDVRWGWGFHLAATLLVFAVVTAARALWRYARRNGSRPQVAARRTAANSADPVATNHTNREVLPSAVTYGWHGWMPAVAGIIIAATMVTVRLIQAVPSPDQITQNYDTVFHDNVVARIVQTGEASSLHALPPIREVYPIAFQQFAALGAMIMPDTTVPAAMTCTWLIFGAVVWPVSILFLVRAVCGRRTLSDFIAPILAAVCAGGPFLLLDWGTLYSMFAGQAMMPVLFALAWTWCRRDWHNGPAAVIGGLAWMAVVGLAVSVAHFRVIMTFLLIAIPLMLAWLVDAAKTLKVHKGVRAMTAAIVAFVCMVAVVFGVGCMVFARMYLQDPSRPISDHLNGGPAQPTEDIPSAIGRFLTGTPINTLNNRLATDWLVVILLLAAAVGIIAVAHGVIRRDGLLLIASFLLLGFVFVSCAGTHADWAKVVTALWYKDQRRPFAAWPMLATPIICLGLNALCDAWQAWSSKRTSANQTRKAGTAMKASATAVVMCAPRCLAALLVLLIGIASPQIRGMMASVSNSYRFANSGQTYPMVSRDEYLLLKRIGNYVPQNEMVVSDPWNGSAFMLAVGGRTPFYAHLSMAWDYDHSYLASNFRNIDTDPEVCAILQRNNLHWYLDMGGSYSDPYDPQHTMFLGIEPVPDAMEAIDSQGDATLYRITACPATAGE